MFILKRSSVLRNGIRAFSHFEQGDFCMLRQVKTNKKSFVGPLEAASEKGVRGGAIAHDSIIGKQPRSIIRTGNGKVQASFNKELLFIFYKIVLDIWHIFPLWKSKDNKKIQMDRANFL